MKLHIPLIEAFQMSALCEEHLEIRVLAALSLDCFFPIRSIRGLDRAKSRITKTDQVRINHSSAIAKERTIQNSSLPVSGTRELCLFTITLTHFACQYFRWLCDYISIGRTSNTSRCTQSSLLAM